MSSYDRAKSIANALGQLGGITRFIRPGATVVIKPNLPLEHSADSANISHPEALVEVVRQSWCAGASRVIVCDFPIDRPEDVARTQTVAALRQLGVSTELRLLSQDSDFVSIGYVDSVGACLRVAREVIEADAVINLAQAKYDPRTGVSLALKNLLGCVWNRRDAHLWPDYDWAITSIAQVIHPCLTILDATSVGAAGTYMPTSQFGKIIVGDTPHAVDALALQLCGFVQGQIPLKEVRHVAIANRDNARAQS